MISIDEQDLGTPRRDSDKQVTLMIDGEEITVPAGTSVMRAAASLGTKIPKLCATEQLEAFGSCRLCLVQIEGMKGLPASCTTLVSEGITLDSNAYGSAFYFTTGFHALHVTGGLIAMLLTLGRAFAVKNFGHKEATTTIVVSYYWHFVDVVWIGLFLVIYVLK